MRLFYRIFLLFIPLILQNCGKPKNFSDYEISKDHIAHDSYVVDDGHVAHDQNYRISSLIIHYTAEPLDKSLITLTLGGVSAHYLIPESQIYGKRLIFQLVEEKNRAYHAGVSYWKGRTNLNDTSIGVEIVNLGFKINEKGEKIWYPFSDYQMETVIQLTKNIVDKYKIYPTCVVGHADIAPGRKEDPGADFKWEKLFINGVGAWPDKKTVEIKLMQLIDKNQLIPISEWQRNLRKYGYDVNLTNLLDDKTKDAVVAFQMHFRPQDYSGNLDYETFAILQALLDKYTERNTCGF